MTTVSKTCLQKVESYRAVLVQAGWDNADVTPMSADMGLRRYYILQDKDRKALLMDMSRAGILEIGLKEYINVAEGLRRSGVRTPQVYFQNLDKGWAIIEDFGRTSFGAQLRSGEKPEIIYTLAGQVLQDIENGAKTNDNMALQGYEDTLIFVRLGQFVEYYYPAATGQAPTDKEEKEFRLILKNIEQTLPECPMGFCHADFHLENIMWCPDHAQKYGLIDFQDAFWGFKGYDLLNLLEDARATVPEAIKKKVRDNFCQAMTSQERAAFDDWYTLLSVHFHLRVIGLFIKFSLENKRQEFLAHIPRLQNYLKSELAQPIMQPVQEWIESKGISFDIPVEDLIKNA